MKQIKRTAIAIAAGMVALTAACGALAYTLNDVLISGTYGTGTENTSVVVIDFGTKSYAFAYNYDGVKSGADAIIDLDTAGIGVDVTYDLTWGLWVSDIAYHNQAVRETTGDWPGWAYYTSENGREWSSSGVGAADRMLSNGSWDAWNYTGWDSAYMPTAPNPVTPAVPESPALLLALYSLIGLAGSAKLLRSRRD